MQISTKINYLSDTLMGSPGAKEGVRTKYSMLLVDYMLTVPVPVVPIRWLNSTFRHSAKFNFKGLNSRLFVQVESPIALSQPFVEKAFLD